MISQNRSEGKRQVIADEQWTTVQEEDHQNRELLHISRQILDLTEAVHAYASGAASPAVGDGTPPKTAGEKGPGAGA